MRALLDVNVLIALLDRDHIHHKAASEWLANNIESGWASCPITQNGCIRIMSQPRYPNCLPVQDVVARLHAACQTSHHQFIAEDFSLLDPEQIEHRHLLSHRQITDTYLLGLASRSECRFVTFDQSIQVRAVRNALPANLVLV